MADPDRGLVTEHELKQLPLWAVVAFAARCARRVLPLFVEDSSGPVGKGTSAVNAAVSVAEVSAREARSLVSNASGAGGAANIARARSGSLAAAKVADAAREAASAAENAAYSMPVGYPAVVTAAAAAARFAGDAAGYTTTSSETADSAARRDFGLLLAFASANRWSDTTPVDPDLLGPLWPTGAPNDWPVARTLEGETGGLLIEFEVPDNMSDEQAYRLIEGYLGRLNGLHRVVGGKGLRISPPIEVTQPARAPVGAAS